MKSLKVGLVADELTRSCLQHEVKVIDLLPGHDKATLARERPDFIFVESAWFGLDNAWRYKVASYPRFWLRNNRAIRKLVRNARELGIPTVFWNKEDSVHFARFIGSARHFDHVFTVDANALPRYRSVMGDGASVHVLPFPVEPHIHNFTGFNFAANDANFVGSYSTHVHDARRVWQHDVFGAVLESGMALTVYDRNSGRNSRNYRYPEWPGLTVQPAVPHPATADIYKRHLVSLNVNTVTDSPTMYSRRLVEILACGGIAVTSSALSVNALFAPYCHVVDTAEQGRELFGRLRHGPSPEDLDRARDGAMHVLAHHTWSQRMAQVAATVGV